jgi:hypothetical protein
MTNQSDVQAEIRAITGTALDYTGDWSALFDAAGITAGAWNGRLLAWINAQLGTSYPDLPGAQNAFAVSRGFTNWSAMGAISVGGTTDVVLIAGGLSGILLAGGASGYMKKAA